MDFLNSLINYDKQLLLFLHSKGSVTWDNFWLFVTNPIHWIPLFFVIYFLGYRTYGIIKSSIITLLITLSGAFSLVIVNLIKNTVERARPINDVTINDTIRLLIEPQDFSFVSGHSTISFTVCFISFWVLKKRYRYTFLLFLFPILFAYSRIYLAAHFPIDILFGMLLGYIIALLFYKIIKKFVVKK